MEAFGTAGKTGQGEEQEGDGGKDRQKEAENRQGDTEPAAGEKEPAQDGGGAVLSGGRGAHAQAGSSPANLSSRVFGPTLRK